MRNQDPADLQFLLKTPSIIQGSSTSLINPKLTGMPQGSIEKPLLFAKTNTKPTVQKSSDINILQFLYYVVRTNDLSGEECVKYGYHQNNGLNLMDLNY